MASGSASADTRTSILSDLRLLQGALSNVGRSLYSNTNGYSHREWRLEWHKGTLLAHLRLATAVSKGSKGMMYPTLRDSKGAMGDIADL